MLIVRRSLFTALLLAITVPRVASAQRIVGPGNDAWTLPPGVLRFEIGSRFLGAHERFGADGRESLAAPFAGILNAAKLPTLSALESDIAALTQNNPFQAALGTARIDAAITAAVIPLSLQAGITSRLTLRASVPLFTGKQEAQWGLDATGATVGANPAVGNAGALANNTAIVGGLEGAAASLETLANNCAANPAIDPRCGQVTAELAAVRDLIERARETTALLARTYGGSTAAPSRFVPLTESDAHAAVVARIAALRSEFDRYQTASVAAGAAPRGAGAPATIADLTAMLADTAQGYALGPIGRRYSQGIGDIDLGVSFRLYDGIATSPWRLGDTVAARGIRQTFGFTYRVGTGTPANAEDPFLLPTGDGQDDLEFLSATDFLANNRFWGSFLVRFTKQQPLDRTTRIPDATGSPFIPLDRRRMARTELGNRIELEALPRWVINDYFAFGLQYRFSTQTAGKVDEIAPFTDNIHLSYAVPSMSAHEVGVGFTWSSISAHRRKRAKLPLEIHWDHSMVIAGSGNAIRFSADRISVRAYGRFWGAEAPQTQR